MSRSCSCGDCKIAHFALVRVGKDLEERHRHKSKIPPWHLHVGSTPIGANAGGEGGILRLAPSVALVASAVSPNVPGLDSLQSPQTQSGRQVKPHHSPSTGPRVQNGSLHSTYYGTPYTVLCPPHHPYSRLVPPPLLLSKHVSRLHPCGRRSHVRASAMCARILLSCSCHSFDRPFIPVALPRPDPG